MKKVVCYYCVATHLGGAERSLLDLLRYVRLRDDLTVKVLLPQSTGPLFAKLEALGIRPDVLPMPRALLSVSRGTPLRSALLFLTAVPETLFYLLRLRRYFSERQVEILHTTGIKCHLLAIPAVWRKKRTVVWHLRDIFRPGLTRSLLRAAYHLAFGKVRLIANSRATAASLSPALPCTIAHNGIDLSVFRREAGSDSRPLVIGIVGVLARWKGQIEFLRMAHALTVRGVQAEFWIVGDQIYDTIGDAGYAEELRDLVQELGLTNVKFLGYRENIIPVLSQMDILVHASNRAEPFGRVLIEAQACGVAVVASGAGGVLEIIEDNSNGLLFRPGDIEHLTHQVRRLAQDSILRQRLVGAATAGLPAKFSLESHVAKVLGVYPQGARE